LLSIDIQIRFEDVWRNLTPRCLVRSFRDNVRSIVTLVYTITYCAHHPWRFTMKGFRRKMWLKSICG